MKTQHKLYGLAAAILVAGSVGGFAIAEAGSQDNDKAEHAAFLSSGVSLSDAVSLAETESGAKAISAEFDDEDGTFGYEIELLSADGTELEAKIDANSGTVLSIATDEQDEDGEGADD